MSENGGINMKWIAEQQVKLKKIAGLDWKRKLSVGQLEVFGLDIGSSAVKMVQLHKKEGDYIVTAAGFADIDGGASDNDSRREINTLKAIRQCLQSSGIQGKFAVCSVGGPESVVRRFTFPAMPPEEVAGAVLLEAKQVSPFNTDEGVVDYQLLPGDKKETNGILVAATNRILKERTRFAEKALLQSVLVDVDGLALSNCFEEYQKYETSQTTAILNIGNSYATLVIIGEDDVPFIRDLTCAGKVIIEQIALKNKASKETVERVLAGREKSNKIQFGLSESLETACHKLITDVTETLRYYTVRRKAGIVEKILVCGGFALVEGFVDLLNERLPVTVELWNPFDKIKYDESLACADVLRKKGPAMAVAAGLAVRTI